MNRCDYITRVNLKIAIRAGRIRMNHKIAIITIRIVRCPIRLFRLARIESLCLAHSTLRK